MNEISEESSSRPDKKLEEPRRKKMLAILRALRDAGGPMGGVKLAEALALSGKEMSQRTIRYYLNITDELGFTELVGKRSGRRLTELGLEELDSSFATDRIRSISSHVDSLIFDMSFRLRSCQGTVAVNISSIPAGRLSQAGRAMAEIYAAGLAMGQRLYVGQPGERIGRYAAQKDEVPLVTVCSMSVNGVFLSHGINVSNRFGGLLQFSQGEPRRFTHLINYDCTTLDPLEIFIKGQMTSVSKVARSGDGIVGASFREIPAPAAPRARRLSQKIISAGLAGVIVVGQPGRQLMEVPVPPGRVGVVVLGGLNPLAAAEECGVPTLNRAMSARFPFELLKPYAEALTF
ncbi:hypothetical protein AAU61_13785 [Desulfocarbo indianensis]|nr:hypothetical protein AAU61_13785 [Desulfocarbo indianensis]